MNLEETLDAIRHHGPDHSVLNSIREAWKTNKKAWKSDWEPALKEAFDDIPDKERRLLDFATWTEIKGAKPWMLLFTRKLYLTDDKFDSKRAEQFGNSKIFDVLKHLELIRIMKKCDAQALVTLFESPGFNAGKLESLRVDITGKRGESDWHRASEALAASDAMQTMRELSLTWRFATGLIGKDFPELESLDLEYVELAEGHYLEPFISWSVLPQLTRLKFSGTIEPDFFVRLAKLDHLHKLESLELGSLSLDFRRHYDTGIDFEPLVEMKSLNGLRELHVTDHSVDVFEWLAQSKHITLLSLELGYSAKFNKGAFKEYIASPMASQLEELTLTTYTHGTSAAEVFEPSRLASEFGRDELEALIAAAPPLRRLSLQGQNIDADTVERLLQAPFMKTLEYLDLRGTPLGNKGVQALANSSDMEGVELLIVEAMLDEVGVEALEASPYISDRAGELYRNQLERSRFVVPLKGYPKLMGELRSLVAGEPSRQAFSQICQLLDDFARTNLVQAREEVLPYLQKELESWPRLDRMVVLTKHQICPDYAGYIWMPPSYLRNMSSRFQGKVSDLKPHELGIELVKGAHIVLGGGYGRYNNELKPSEFLKNSRFLELEAVVFNRSETTEEQEYQNDFREGEVLEIIKKMPNLVELHVGLSVNLNMRELLRRMASSPHFDGRLEVLGIDYMDGGCEVLASKSAFKRLETLYLVRTLSGDEFVALCDSPHLESLRTIYGDVENQDEWTDRAASRPTGAITFKKWP